MNLGIIYRATSPSGKCYVGQTVQELKVRKRCHQADSKRHDYAFARAIKKYGIECFNWEVICEDVLEKHLDEYEIFYIDFYSSFRMGYNGDEGGKTRKGFKHTEETKIKMSKAKKGKALTEEHRRKISKSLKGNQRSLGYKHTKKTRKKMSKAQTGTQAGEKHPMAKLTLKQVKEIREKYNTGNYLQKQLGKKYSVHQATIQKIIKNITWKKE